MASGVIPGCQVMSDLLTFREKGVLFTLLHPQCKLIKSTVAQVLVAEETGGESPGWTWLGCGAVCLIEDTYIHTYFLRLYCVKHATLLWEQELYIPFKYTAPCKFFHTFPADGNQVGLNFANEAEAEEFLLSVEAVQRDQEKMTMMSEKTDVEKKIKSTSDLPNFGTIKRLDLLDKEQHFQKEERPMLKELDPGMRRLLVQASLTEEDLQEKDVSEAVDCIIKQFGGIKAVQRELRNRGPVSHTLPRAAGASISLALKKGPLPPVPSQGSSTSQSTPPFTNSLHQSTIPLQIPLPPSTPAPVLTERIRKSASFKPVASQAASEKGDLILNAMRELFRQKKMQRTSADQSDIEPDTKSDEIFGRNSCLN
ncbi:actin nucleation-promoting factor WAS [Eleginops maclovinus]|uniref:actin nucleation-promoting factor WAS n=1 Tax=Eleginops maclovinus TaxID=56733 RepID=UPI003080A95F